MKRSKWSTEGLFFPSFLNGDIVRHTGKFLKAIGSPTGNPINGIVTNCAKRFGKQLFIEVQWSDSDVSVLVNPVNVERF